MRGNQTITTSLIHKRENGEISWWQTTVICDMPGLWDNCGLRQLSELLPQIAELGFESLLIRPAGPIVEGEVSFLPDFVAAAHRVGLRVIVRVFILPEGSVLEAPDSPPLLHLEDDVALVTERIRTALESGVDGVDLGTIELPGELVGDSERSKAFSSAVNFALAELAGFDDDRILTAALPAEPEEEFVRHLREDWFHHLRSSVMFDVEWRRDDMRQAITRVFSQRDSLGLSTPWRHALVRPQVAQTARTSADTGWARGASAQRHLAMNLFVSALPGSAYLPFLQVGGSTHYPADNRSAVEVSLGATEQDQINSQGIAQALHIRREQGLAVSPLAFIDGLPWAGDDTLVMLVGHTMVVLNMSERRISVPRSYWLIASSGEAGTIPGGGTSMAPDTCCWFQTADLQPTDPGNYPRQ